MAKSKLKDLILGFIKKPKKKRPGVHSKKKTSVLKSSKNWAKPYKGQGK